VSSDNEDVDSTRPGKNVPSTRRIEWQNGVFDRSAETAFHTTSSVLEACLEHSKHHNLSGEVGDSWLVSEKEEREEKAIDLTSDSEESMAGMFASTCHGILHYKFYLCR
jgi:hypothetical protein